MSDRNTPRTDNAAGKCGDASMRYRGGDGLMRTSFEIVDAGTCRQIETELMAAQARIDALMLEYCPDEMTAEQLKIWGDSQRPAGES